MFRIGFAGVMVSATTAYTTPGGVLEAEAGYALERTVSGGHINDFSQSGHLVNKPSPATSLHVFSISTLQGQIEGLTYEAWEDVNKKLLSLRWARTLLNATPWTAVPPPTLQPFGRRAGGGTANPLADRFVRGLSEYELHIPTPRSEGPLVGNATPISAGTAAVAPPTRFSQRIANKVKKPPLGSIFK
ncbi:hypothetical protein HKX48_007986 [Thoreauomyces humboldtii]|nr:hypothetical protein HKX48_007986 [Thoreauomyces humboldtii]